MDNFKNYLLFNQDISGIKNNLKSKVFKYFYRMIDSKITN